jgi:beta-glucanase (GH16 family)
LGGGWRGREYFDLVHPVKLIRLFEGRIPVLFLAGVMACAPKKAEQQPPAELPVPRTIVSPLGKTMTLRFHDEFKAVTDPRDGQPYIDRTKWRTTFWQGSSERTLAGNGEAQYYLDKDYAGKNDVPVEERINPFSFSKPGILTISAFPVPRARWADWGMNTNRYFASGLLISDPHFTFQYGYIEGRFKLPGTRGSWPAFWLLMNDPRMGMTPAQQHRWPPEIDIFEFFGHRPTKFSSALHVPKGHWANWKGGWGIKYYEGTEDLSREFHTWGCEWNENEIAFTFDGQIWARATTPDSLKVRMYLLVNLAVGGNWYAEEMAKSGHPIPPWDVDETTMPWKMECDYVRVYQE